MNCKISVCFKITICSKLQRFYWHTVFYAHFNYEPKQKRPFSFIMRTNCNLFHCISALYSAFPWMTTLFSVINKTTRFTEAYNFSLRSSDSMKFCAHVRYMFGYMYTKFHIIWLPQRKIIGLRKMHYVVNDWKSCYSMQSTLTMNRRQVHEHVLKNNWKNISSHFSFARARCA